MNTGGTQGASPLGDRYRVVRELGRGGFGQTYLAEDKNRYDERCVVKEFVPQLDDKKMLEKAKMLFEREANILYQISHKQIPEFRQLLQVDTETGGRLFLVQDYVEGPSYQKLLQDRKRFGGNFRETEITQLLYDVLPVLSYVHSLGMVHRDISPENLILRQADGLPVLIDFGRVKEVAASVRSQLAIDDPAENTRIGKVGYAPQEQLSAGEVNATSDLYALAVTLLVLFTGEEPQVLHDAHEGTWSGFDSMSPKLRKILTRMLKSNPEARFQSAEAVLAALKEKDPVDSFVADGRRTVDEPEPTVAATAAGAVVGAAAGAAASDPYIESFYSEDEPGDEVVNPEIAAEVLYEPAAVVETEPLAADTYATAAFGPTTAMAGTTSVYEPVVDEVEEVRKRNDSQQALIGLLAVAGLIGTLLLFAWARLWNNRASVIASNGNADSTLVNASGSVNNEGYTNEEVLRRQEIRTRREALGIQNNYFTRLIDQLFYGEYPQLETSGPNGGRKALTASPEDEPLRIRWDNIALNVLDRLESDFSDRTLSSLGNYSDRDRSGWLSEVNAVNVSSNALDDLTDAKFLSLFPGQTGSDLFERPTGQFYYAIADDRTEAILNGASRQDVVFDTGAFRQDLSGRLSPGEGQIYTMRLSEGQLLRLNLDSPTDTTLLSLYTPLSGGSSDAIFADSRQATWSGSIDQTGYYQVVVVNQSAEPIEYGLALSVDRVSSAPVAPAPEEEQPDAQTDPQTETPEEEPEAEQTDLPPAESSAEDETSAE